jgi:hypothetical protein
LCNACPVCSRKRKKGRKIILMSRNKLQVASKRYRETTGQEIGEMLHGVRLKNAESRKQAAGGRRQTPDGRKRTEITCCAIYRAQSR